MSSIWKCVITFVVAALLTAVLSFFLMHMRMERVTEEYQGEIAQLTATLDALGQSVECYTVSEQFVYHFNNDVTGQILTEDSIAPITIPSSLVGDAYITDPSELIGKYCKVNICAGTPLTSDLLMSEWYDDTLRDVDISVNSRVVGMRAGDYVDIRITMPYGEDYVIFPHKRVQQMNERTLKFYLTEEEWHTWQAATVDYYLNSASGCRIYLTKYIEPGVQKSAISYYAPSQRIYDIMLRDPNIVTEAKRSLDVAQTNRAGIENVLSEFITESTTVQQQVGQLAGGRNSWSNDVGSDYRTAEQNRPEIDEELDTYTEGAVLVDLEQGEETASVTYEETSTYEEEETTETASATYEETSTYEEEETTASDEFVPMETTAEDFEG